MTIAISYAMFFVGIAAMVTGLVMDHSDIITRGEIAAGFGATWMLINKFEAKLKALQAIRDLEA